MSKAGGISQGVYSMLKSWHWHPPAEWPMIQTIDLHTGGEPLRVITSGLPEIPGNTVLEKRRYFREHYDSIRHGIIGEPRGHADMYAAVLTEPFSPESDFGVFFLHNEGYSTMCGHAIIALVTLVLDTGMIRKPGNEPEINIDAPAGLIRARALRKSSRVERVFFRNVPSFLALRERQVEVPGLGRVVFDLAYGGAFYAFCAAEPLGLQLAAADYGRLIDYGRRIKHAVMEQFEVKHPFEPDLSFLYGTIFTGLPQDPSHHSRNVCIFADGEVDRSATGTGVSARAAIHHAKGELPSGQIIAIESILGTTMEVRVVDTLRFGPYEAVVPEVSGTAAITGQNQFYFDPADPLRDGFFLR